LNDTHHIDLSALSGMIASLVEDVKESVVTVLVEIPSLDVFLFQQPVRSVGSGFAISSKYVITNAHVVRDSVEAVIVYPNGDYSKAEVLASDPSRDLALLEVYTGLKPLKLGDSDKVRVGELVFAIGSPLGLPGPSVTIGVVSALGRTIVTGDLVFEDLIQTDAAINPGNSGGPLINSMGEAVGVTTAMIPYAQGIGFAIPINTVKRFLHMLEKHGRPLRAWIGVYVAQLTRNTSKLMNIPVEEGLIVVRIIPGSPAHRAGIKPGDVIIEANGRALKKVSDLRAEIEDSIDKGYVKLKIARGRYTFEVDVPIVVEEI